MDAFQKSKTKTFKKCRQNRSLRVKSPKLDVSLLHKPVPIIIQEIHTKSWKVLFFIFGEHQKYPQMNIFCIFAYQLVNLFCYLERDGGWCSSYPIRQRKVKKNANVVNYRAACSFTDTWCYLCYSWCQQKTAERKKRRRHWGWVAVV